MSKFESTMEKEIKLELKKKLIKINENEEQIKRLICENKSLEIGKNRLMDKLVKLKI